MTRDWARLGQRLKAARAAREIPQQDLAETIGVKRGALHNIERGEFRKVTPTVIAYAREVGWAEGSIERVLDGGDPVEREISPVGNEPTEHAGESAGEREAPSDLSLLVQQSLKEGPLVDARVAEVTTSAGRLKATIVIRGEEGAPMDELLAALRKLKIDVEVDE
ncbi:helix-turn-helix transcriptional regulator [Streptomyces sp. AJS327]|uniref:helix-turn-helix domain-containing protein n=1 Tax=Streptomyces sp. AJS327 TaxID=2545265 RepID=UPI0015E0003F|nr:helix-turn-helix transcriptional regulator [Streptomyces sp. AJS327]